jgi:hypothetical protein
VTAEAATLPSRREPKALEEDVGYGGEPASRFGIVYEADWGGADSGCYVVVDRVQGFRMAWRMRVERYDGARKTQERLDRLRELVAGENLLRRHAGGSGARRRAPS